VIIPNDLHLIISEMALLLKLNRVRDIVRHLGRHMEDHFVSRRAIVMRLCCALHGLIQAATVPSVSGQVNFPPKGGEEILIIKTPPRVRQNFRLLFLPLCHEDDSNL